jgi:hypothetical protein
MLGTLCRRGPGCGRTHTSKVNIYSSGEVGDVKGRQIPRIEQVLPSFRPFLLSWRWVPCPDFCGGCRMMIMALTGLTAILARLRLTSHHQKCEQDMTTRVRG